MKATQRKRDQQGFTLVELAIVMIIIGLLIGGILKGQELITNAAVTATIAQMKGVDSAMTTFRDMYDSLPGDMTAQPATRLPNCGGVCDVQGNGDRRIAGPPGIAPTAEMRASFAQLSAAGLVTGVNINMAGAANTWGGEFPEAEIGGGITVAYFVGGGALGANLAASRGHYVTLYNAPGAAAPAPGTTITPNQAARVDAKMDDGDPTAGSVFPTAPGGCVLAGIYDEQADGTTCDLFVRVQN